MEALNKADKKLKLPLYMKPVVTNLVVTVNFSCKFDLLKIASQIKKAKFQSKFFPAAILHIDEPKCTAIIFKQGKVNIVGTRSSDEAYIAARKIGKILNKIDYNVKIQEFKIANIIAVSNCNFEIELESIASNPHYKQLAVYNPRNMAGLVFKIPDINVTLLILPFGKIVFNGAKNLSQLNQAANFIWPILKENEVPDYRSDYYQSYPPVEHNESQPYLPYIPLQYYSPYEHPVQTYLPYEPVQVYHPYPQPAYPLYTPPPQQYSPYPHPSQPTVQPYAPYQQPPQSYAPYSQTPYSPYPQPAQSYPYYEQPPQPYVPYEQSFGPWEQFAPYQQYNDQFEPYDENPYWYPERRKSHHRHHQSHHRHQWK